MLRAIRTSMLRLYRRMLGTWQLYEKQELFDWRNKRRHDRQMATLLKLGNALAYSQADPDTIKATALYRRCAAIVALLTPMDPDGAAFVRVGRDHDGGYVMVDRLQPDIVEAAYGFGIATDTSWDEAIAARGIDVYMFDHTIKVLPAGLPRCRAFATGITGRRKGPALRTLSELLAEHGHAASRRLIMKMDVEGSEWDVFDEAASEVLDQFSQIVVEYHDLTAAVYSAALLEKVRGVLTKLNRTHQSVHVHANGLRLPLWVGPLVLPDILEVTYVRRTDWEGRLSPSRRLFPTDLDMPSDEGSPDIYLGRFAP